MMTKERTRVSVPKGKDFWVLKGGAYTIEGEKGIFFQIYVLKSNFNS